MPTVKFRIRRDIAANWTVANPILALGEPGLETDTRRVKYGDGATRWTSLGYAVGAFSGTLPISQGGTGRTTARPVLIASRSVTSGSFQTIGRAFATLQINAKTVDTADAFDLITSLYTAPETGIYLTVGKYKLAEPAPAGVNCGIGIDVVSNDNNQAAAVWQTTQAPTSGTSRHVMQITRMLSVAAGQQIRLFGYIDSATAVGIRTADLSITML